VVESPFMVGKRRWLTWPAKFVAELNSTSGLAGAGGAVLAVLAFGGLTAASGPLAVVVGGLGILLTAGAAVASGTKSFPPRLVNPTDIVGEDKAIGQLDSLEPRVFAVGIVGPSEAGKSTLASQILHKPKPRGSHRTQGVHCYIAALQTAPVMYIAMIDGPGDKFAAQFEVVEHSHIVLVALDHSDSGGVATEAPRIAEHRRFQKQLRDYLVARSKTMEWVHLLMNKRDLWERGPHQDLLDFLKVETDEWTKSNLSRRVTSAVHSNESAYDITELLKDVAAFLESHKPK